jgi:8-oxo-dGTP pyrophosphatase MutT (NUDIX family)
MYKVFFNDSTFQIGVESKKSSKNNINQRVDSEDSGFVRDLIAEIEKGDEAISFSLQNNETELLWECFKRQFVEIPAAGGLVKSSDDSLLFIKRLGLWDLPKGKIDKGETPEIAAIREVEEECGVKGLRIIRLLGSTYHIYRSPFLKFPDNLVLKETKWFLMSCDDDQTLVPQSEENIDEVKWFALNELDVVMENTYLSLREFLSKTIPLI